MCIRDSPNTLGLFERSIPEIAEMVHQCGALMYYDGANLNPMLGACRPGDMGFDVMHINLHKTFSTPHGGGGPGSGPVGVRADMVQFLPKPTVKKLDDGSFTLVNDLQDGTYDVTRNHIGAFLGNFAVIPVSYTHLTLPTICSV